jgi:hypothetical protein
LFLSLVETVHTIYIQMKIHMTTWINLKLWISLKKKRNLKLWIKDCGEKYLRIKTCWINFWIKNKSWDIQRLKVYVTKNLNFYYIKATKINNCLLKNKNYLLKMFIFDIKCKKKNIL